MRGNADTSRYHLISIALHWVIGLGILGLILLGLAMTHLALPAMLKFQLYQLHKSIGITVLMAVLLRIVWRLTHRPPALPEMSGFEKNAAEGAHIALYLLMVILPMTGWALVSVSPFDLPTVLFSVIPWPHLPILADLHHKAPVEALLKLLHRALAWGFGGLILVHAGAALRHHFILRDTVLRRMLPSFGKGAIKESQS